jgi:hypothetical protein
MVGRRGRRPGPGVHSRRRGDRRLRQGRPQPSTGNRLENSLSLGVDQRLAEHTKLFGFYTTGDIGGTSEKNEYVAVGIQHNF